MRESNLFSAFSHQIKLLQSIFKPGTGESLVEFVSLQVLELNCTSSKANLCSS